MYAHKIEIGKIGPGRHQKSKGRTGNTKRIKNFGRKIVALNGIINAYEKVDTAKVKRKKFPFPLSGCGGTDVFEKFVRKKKNGNSKKKFLSFLFAKLFINNHRTDYYRNKNTGYGKMNGAEMFKTYVIGKKFVHC